MPEYFYHCTDDEGAHNIIRSARILASLSFMTNGDAGFGNGVYLTKMDPKTHSKEQIAMNNWTNTSALAINKTKNYFVFKIPDSDTKDAGANGRDIFLFDQRKDLRLHKYHW